MCLLDSRLDNVAPLKIEAIWWLAKNGRVKLSEGTTSIFLPTVAYPVIFQGLKDSCQVRAANARASRTLTMQFLRSAKHCFD